MVIPFMFARGGGGDYNNGNKKKKGEEGYQNIEQEDG